VNPEPTETWETAPTPLALTDDRIVGAATLADGDAVADVTTTLGAALGVATGVAVEVTDAGLSGVVETTGVTLAEAGCVPVTEGAAAKPVCSGVGEVDGDEGTMLGSTIAGAVGEEDGEASGGGGCSATAGKIH